jgi:hypothetical protein
MEQRLMPKKIRPKYGIDAVQEVPAFSFSDAEIERLFNALAPVKGDRHEIIAHLERCARDYFWLRNQNQELPTRAEQNAVLKEVSHLARNLEMRLRALNMDTEWELMMELSAFHSIKKVKHAIPDLARQLEYLAEAADGALGAGKQKSGPRIQTHVQRAVDKLAHLYEQFTSESFSHNPKLLTEYGGEPHSRAGRFVVAFFEIVDRNIPPTSLSTAMASIVKSRGARQNAATS